MSPDKESITGKKRESRAGTRKVTSLTTEQLERKRANDREAQRTIRQRTKEHIEHLEHQVAELSVKGEQFDNVLRRNAALEAEIAHLRHQLAMMSNRPLYPVDAVDGSRRSSTASIAQSVVPSPYPEPHGESAPRIPSIPSTSSRVSLPYEWQSYSPTPSSICESSKADYSSEVEPYGLEGHVQVPIDHTVNTMNLARNQVGFNIPGGPHLSALESYPQMYPSNGESDQAGRGYLTQSASSSSVWAAATVHARTSSEGRQKWPGGIPQAEYPRAHRLPSWHDAPSRQPTP